MERKWFERGFVYQIYPKSFMDSNNDGIGDLRGIINKIPYLKKLGITMVWLSPIYKSPMADNGYDIADYYNIDPSFGTMADFDEMIDKFNKVGINVIMDLVINHTSDEHHWFIEACKSKDNQYHDYYLFQDKPNNWTSFFGGSTWEYVPTCNQYYLHLFGKKQPDLNWDNQLVREEIKKILHFWLNKGVKGFRCDVINLISKNTQFPNGIDDVFLIGKEHYINGPHLHDYLKELNNDVLKHYDCFTVGECGVIDPIGSLKFTSQKNKELNMLFQFNHMGVDGEGLKWMIKPFKKKDLKEALYKWQRELQDDGWNTLYFENHDQPRSVSRFGDINYRTKSAMMLAMFLFLQKGTSFIYQGEKIGMTNISFTNISEYRDIESLDIYNTGINKYHFTKEEMIKKLNYISRDNARTPMQWDDTDNAGFSKTIPWIKVNDNYRNINVKKDLNSKDSIFKFYQKLIKLKMNHSELIDDDFIAFDNNDDITICYQRKGLTKSYYVVCNYSDKKRRLALPFLIKNGIIVLSNYKITNSEEFLPYEGRVYSVQEEQ